MSGMRRGTSSRPISGCSDSNFGAAHAKGGLVDQERFLRASVLKCRAVRGLSHERELFPKQRFNTVAGKSAVVQHEHANSESTQAIFISGTLPLF